MFASMVSTMEEKIDRNFEGGENVLPLGKDSPKPVEKSLDFLVCEIAHDLNNMLTIILGYAGLAEIKSTDSVKRYLRDIKIAGNQARDLVGQLQAIKCPSELVPYSIPLDQIVQETLDRIKGLCPPNIQFVFVNPQLPVKIVAHPIQIQQVVTNLCTNAIQAMGNNRGILKVSLSLTELEGENFENVSPGAKVSLIFQDTGCGMKPEILDRIFEPFFTTKTPGEAHGLGMRIVDGIMARLKGAISVHSKPGKGTTVVLLFPIDPEFPENQDSQ